MKYKELSDVPLLPTLPEERIFRADHETCKAIFQTVDDEIRIAYVSREEKGDFKELMDRLVDDLDHNVIRFISTSDHPAYFKMLEIGPPDSRPIKDAVDGFDEETITEYQSEQGYQPVETLIGRWEPR